MLHGHLALLLALPGPRAPVRDSVPSLRVELLGIHSSSFQQPYDAQLAAGGVEGFVALGGATGVHEDHLLRGDY